MMLLQTPDTCAKRTRSAAPAGGARLRGRGCALGLVLFGSLAAASQPVLTPSGQAVTLEEILLDENPGALWVRFRFLAPDLAALGDIDPDQSAVDMQALCDQIAVPYLVDNAIEPVRIVISMSDRKVPFGQSDPAATQFFELFRLENAACIWEEF